MLSRPLTSCFLAVLVLAALPAADAQRKKNDEPITQTLEVFPDPPAALKVETARLVFHVSPLTGKGLMSAQVREAIKALWRINGGATIVKLRALVAGSGDLRRVQTIVSEMFTDKRVPLPVLSVVQVGVLPMEGAQVIIEATSLAKKPVNPHGLAFISGQAAAAPVKPDQSSIPVAAQAALSIARLRTSLESISLTSKDVVRMTCYTSSLDDHADVRRIVSTEFQMAALTIAQVQREQSNASVECEAVARLNQPPGAPLRFLNPPGLNSHPRTSQIAVVGAKRLVLSGSQLAFRYQDSDVRLAFERLKSSLEQAGTSIRNVAASSVYPLSAGMAERIGNLSFEFFDKQNPPATTMLPFEGLPSLDASFGVDVVAVLPDSSS